MVNTSIRPLCLPLAIMLGAVPAAAARENAGVTLAARGEVEAFDLLDEVSRALSRRSDVFNVDSIVTGSDSQAQIRMVDDAVISVRSDSELVIAEYQYDEETGEGRATMELVSGGLRALTGNINPDSEDSDYEVRTSVGSIGIRGTHFEALQSGDNVLLGVWDGEIEVNLTVGGSGQVVLGSDQEYSFASVNEQGEVTFLLEPPAEFDSGHTADDDEEEPEEESTEEQDEEDVEDSEEESEEDEDDEADDDESDEEAEDDPGNEEDDDGEGVTEDDEDVTEEVESDGSDEQAADEEEPVAASTQAPSSGALDAASQLASESTIQTSTPPQTINPINLPTPPNVVAERSGTASYQNVISAELEGSRSDFEVAISFNVNFTRGTVDDGRVSLTADDGVAWLGLFNGGVKGNELQIGSTIGENLFNQALYTDANGNSHQATGKLNGTFFGASAERVSGDFSLQKHGDSSVWVSGDYIVGEAD